MPLGKIYVQMFFYFFVKNFVEKFKPRREIVMNRRFRHAENLRGASDRRAFLNNILSLFNHPCVNIVIQYTVLHICPKPRETAVTRADRGLVYFMRQAAFLG